LNELIDSVLAKDKEFVSWRAEHKGSFAPLGQAARTEGPRQASRQIAPRSSPRADASAVHR
jgi:hypothetical protein